MSLDIAILAYVILPTSSAHVICEPNRQVVACIVYTWPVFCPLYDVLSHLLWFLGEYILFQADFKVTPLQTYVCRSINVSIG